MESESQLHQQRLHYQPKLPRSLDNLHELYFQSVTPSRSSQIHEKLHGLFPYTQQLPHVRLARTREVLHNPLKVGVVFSGGQAAGGHNVVTGLFDALQKIHPESKLFGFLNGPAGILGGDSIPLTPDILDRFRNQGGFDLLGSSRIKIETPEQFTAAENAVRALDLDGLVVVGGDDSNTNAAFLAEYFVSHACKTKVIGIPKTIDGDLKNESIECSFGFDSACKTYGEIVGNICRDSLSQKKYYFFIKLMGRSASHIALECALQTHPNMALIGEEVAARGQTVRDITLAIADLICRRSAEGKDYGVILLPEGLIEFIPECRDLIAELNSLLIADKPHAGRLEALGSEADQIQYIMSQLSKKSADCFASLPSEMQQQLILDRDPHGNVQVSKIETERLFIETVKAELKNARKNGKYQGAFSAQPIFCGYEGRCCLPSNFDADYCYTLGHAAALLVDSGMTGYIACVKDLNGPAVDWQVGAVPIISMMDIEMRSGKHKAVIRKALVDLHGIPFATYAEQRNHWAMNDMYRYPGPIQFFGPEAVTENRTVTMAVQTPFP